MPTPVYNGNYGTLFLELSNTDYSITQDVGSMPGRCVLFHVHYWSDQWRTFTCTAGGVAATFLGQIYDNAGGNTKRMALYAALNVPSGTITITCRGNTNAVYVKTTPFYYVNSVAWLNAYGHFANKSPGFSYNVTTNKSEVLVATGASDYVGAYLSAASPQTSYYLYGGQGNGFYMGTLPVATPQTVTITWNNSSTENKKVVAASCQLEGLPSGGSQIIWW